MALFLDDVMLEILGKYMQHGISDVPFRSAHLECSLHQWNTRANDRVTLMEVFWINDREFRMHPELICGLVETGTKQGNLGADKTAVRERLCQRYHQATI